MNGYNSYIEDNVKYFGVRHGNKSEMDERNTGIWRYTISLVVIDPKR